MAYKNHTENEPEVKITLTNGDTQENGPDRLGGHLDAKGQGACQNFKKNKITIITFLLLLVSVIGNIIQAVPKKQLQAIPSLLDACPTGWIKKEDSCYFFSDVEKDWISSQTNCSSYGASLVTLDSKQEWDLVKHRKDDNWIGLRRKKADQPWKWPDGSNVTQFDISGTGLCGFMTYDKVSSTACDNKRLWICKKLVRAA